MREKSWWTNIAVFIMVQVDMVWPTLSRLVGVILTKNKLKYMWIKPVKSIPQIMVMVDCLGKIKFKESLLKISRNGSSAEKWALLKYVLVCDVVTLSFKFFTVFL